MGKYKYDKKVLKNLSVKPFLNQVALREEKISEGKAEDIVYEYNVNKLASSLHPSHILVKVTDIIVLNDDAKKFVLEPQSDYGFTKLPYFRAGQYISISLKIGSSVVSRPYTLSSNPALALGETNNKYYITVKRKEGGFVSNYLLDKGFVHMEFTISAPVGEFYYNKIRDSKDVIAIAGGSGITPFISMASAISTGIEDFNLTILYGSRTKKDILLKKELDDLVNLSKGKVKVVYVLSDEKQDGNISKTSGETTIGELDSNIDNSSIYEYGFITSDIIKKYAGEKDYSVFACGPQAMYNFLKKELANLEIPRRRIRFECSGEVQDVEKEDGYPEEFKSEENNEYTLTLNIRGKIRHIPCYRKETLIQAIERAGIMVTTDCRSGECGWCRSRLIQGNIFMPKDKDKRRLADRKFNWIHPCITYPLGNVSLDVFPMA